MCWWAFQCSLILFVLLFYKNSALPNIPNQEYCLKPYNESKTCLLRSEYKSRNVWNHYAGFMCFKYTNHIKFINSFKPITIEEFNFTCNGTGLRLPVALVHNESIALFDYNHAESSKLLKKYFLKEFYNNYVKCCTDSEDCCDKNMTEENIKQSPSQCPMIWDGWSCFPETPVNTTQNLTCSPHVYQESEKVCTLKSQKRCFWNQTRKLAMWNQTTNYSGCALTSVYLRRNNYYVTALLVCIICCIPAIIIFLAIPVFRETLRVILHRNLLIAIVVRDILIIMAKKIVIIDALLPPTISHHVIKKNSISCRVLAFFVSAATNSTYACMLMDGFYLHKVIVRTFSESPRLITIYSVVAVLTFLPSIIHAVILASNGRDHCWMVDKNGEQWAVDSFRVVILSINTLLLLDIIRVMLFKMKQRGPTKPTMVAFRATLFLMPLFGLHILITAKKIVIDDSCLAEDVYDYFRYTMEAIQGIYVALFFCYTNGEVHYELGNILRKTVINLNQKYGWNLNWMLTTQRITTTSSDVENSFI